MGNSITDCLLCGGKAELKHSEYPGYQEPLTFSIFHCSQCNTAFSLPRGDSSGIYEHIYKNGDRVPGYNRYWRYAKIVKQIPDPFDYLAESHEDYWSVREALRKYVHDIQSARILEIGSGLGYLTYSLNMAGYNATGMDVSQTAVDEAIENFGRYYVCSDLFDFTRVAAELYDIVILTEVIEHVSDPLEFVRAIYKLLKPGGRAIISTPNKSFYPDEVIWASDLPPVHCWWLSEDSMSYIAGRLDMKISFVSFQGYYKKNYRVIDTRPSTANRLPEPFLSKDGTLLKEAGPENSIKSMIRTISVSLPALGRVTGSFRQQIIRLYGKIRRLIIPGTIVCEERGYILCSVMHKPSGITTST